MARGRKLAARKGGFLLIKSLFLIEKLFPDRNDILVYKYPTIDQPDVSSYVQRRPGPDDPHWKIPVTEWATVLHRIDQGEPLRKVASDYGVSYETVPRIIRAVHDGNRPKED